MVLAIVLVATQVKKEPKEIKIGAVLPLTGPAATLGEWIKQGYQLAVSDINAAGGINGEKIKLIIEDGMGDPKTSVSAFRKLVEIENVKIVLGVVSSVCLALKPLADESKILFFADVGHPQITGDSKYVFRHSQTADQEATVISQFIVGDKNLKKGLVIVGSDDYGISFLNKATDNFKNANVKIENITFEVGTKDFKTITQKAIKYAPQFVILGGGDPKGIGLLVKKLREYNYKSLIITTMAFTFPDALKSAGSAGRGVYFTDFVVHYEDTLYNVVNGAYEKIYKRKIPPITLFEYNSVRLISRSIQKVGYNPDKISGYLLEMVTYNGVGEKITITPKGDLSPEMIIRKYE